MILAVGACQTPGQSAPRATTTIAGGALSVEAPASCEIM